jgi:hypothetical protein
VVDLGRHRRVVRRHEGVEHGAGPRIQYGVSGDLRDIRISIRLGAGNCMPDTTILLSGRYSCALFPALCAGCGTIWR